MKLKRMTDKFKFTDHMVVEKVRREVLFQDKI